MVGVKYDDDKIRYDLIHPEALKEFAQVLTFGSKKYDDDNWKKVPGLKKRYTGACMRHFEAYRSGELLDPESGLPHLAHAMCCIMFLMWKGEK